MRKSGVKFGLIGTASSLKKGKAKAGRPIGSKPEPRRRPPGATSVFDANSDDDEEGSKGDIDGVAAVNKRLAAISAKQEKQAKKEYEDALEADPSVFDYDRVYDGMKERCVCVYVCVACLPDCCVSAVHWFGTRLSSFKFVENQNALRKYISYLGVVKGICPVPTVTILNMIRRLRSAEMVAEMVFLVPERGCHHGLV